jgi:hypothetical protein
LVDSEPEGMLMHHITEGKFESKLANHVIQYIFHGITGFRWEKNYKMAWVHDENHLSERVFVMGCNHSC